jgi:hypothetical protein
VNPPTVSALVAAHVAAVEALDATSKAPADYSGLDDAALVELAGVVAKQKQLAEAGFAVLAGEIARRSARKLGQSGLAQREGYRSPEEFLRVITGASGKEATVAVGVGQIMREAATEGEVDPLVREVVLQRRPWLAPVARAVGEGSLSVPAADAIRYGLGKPVEGVGVDVLGAAAELLCAEAASLDVDRLAQRARELRNEIDASGSVDRERQRIESRSFTVKRLDNGMGRITWDLDPEGYAEVVELYDRATAPKRGVRFVSGGSKETAERIIADPRTIAQLASDTMLGMLRAGAAVDPSQLIRQGAASIRVLVTRAALDGRQGRAWIEGSPDPVSIETVERLECVGESIPVDFDTSGQPLDVGREQRFFTWRQRVALAARDGGCRFGKCEMPPSFTEAHHIRFWDRDTGSTDVADGMLLCKFHHLLVHNNGWGIDRVGSDYYLTPPAKVDPARTPWPMPSKSAAMKDLAAEQSS